MLSPILSVVDIDASVRFYVEALGFEHEWSMKDDAGSTNFASVKLGDAVILLGTIDFVAEADRDKRGLGIQLHVEVPADRAIDDLYRQAQAANANITRAIETRDWGQRAFNINDPDGYNFMFAQSVPKSS